MKLIFTFTFKTYCVNNLMFVFKPNNRYFVSLESALNSHSMSFNVQ